MRAMVDGLKATARAPEAGAADSKARQQALQEYPEAFGFEDVTRSADAMERGTEFLVPGSGGKRLWIYPISPEDSQDVTIWLTPYVRAHAKRLRLGTSQEDQQVLSQVLQADVQVLTVVAACRMGPLRVHPRCFDPDQVPTLKRYLTMGVVAQICRICDERSHSFDPLQEAIQAFFTDAQSFFSTLSSALSTVSDCPPGLLAQASDLASRAGRLATPEGRLSALVT